MSAEQLARLFHEAYERLAPGFGYATRSDTRAFLPESANGRLMIAVAGEVLAALAPGAPAAEEEVITDAEMVKWLTDNGHEVGESLLAAMEKQMTVEDTIALQAAAKKKLRDMVQADPKPRKKPIRFKQDDVNRIVRGVLDDLAREIRHQVKETPAWGRALHWAAAKLDAAPSAAPGAPGQESVTNSTHN